MSRRSLEANIILGHPDTSLSNMANDLAMKEILLWGTHGVAGIS